MSDGCLCPSGRCRTGSRLFGVQTEGGLAFVRPALQVTPEFLERLDGSDVPAESRFRFSEDCVERGCRQWNGLGCSLIERLLDHVAQPAGSGEDLPACGIRSRCRWYAQEGKRACGICPLVVTDNRSAFVPITLE
jgi:hypothetical protein